MRLARLLLPVLFAFCIPQARGTSAQETPPGALRAKVESTIQRLHSRLDPRDAAELALLSQDLAAEDLEQGRVREAFAALGPAIHFQRRCLDAGAGDVEPSRVLLASLYESFGVALTHLGEFEFAAASFSFAEEEVAKLGDRDAARFPPASPARDAARQETYLAVRRAAAWRAAGDPEGALRTLRDLAQAGKADRLDSESAAFFFSERGNALEDLGHFSEAVEDYERARSLWKQIGDRKREVFELKTMGDALRRMGKPQEALARYEEALAMTPGVPFSPLELHECYTGLALVLIDLGRHEDALSHLAKALRQLEAFHRNLAGSERVATRTRSFAAVSAALGAWARLRFDRDGDAMSWPSLVEVDRWRGLGLARVAEARRTTDGVAANLEKERSLLRREMQMHSGDPGERAALRQRLSEIDLNLMGAELLRAGPSGDSGKSLDERRVPDGGMLLEYFVAPEDAFLWVLGKDGCRWFSLAKGKEQASKLGESISDLCRAISKRRDAAAEGKEAMDLAHLLLPADLLDSISQARFVWIVPDGEVHQVPWAALPWKGNAGMPSIAVLPSAAFAFGMSERALAPASGADILAAPAAQAEGFDPLLFSESEGKAIAALLPGARLRLGEDASEDALRASANVPAAVLHISSHGIFSRNIHGGSALLLAPGEKEDGWAWGSEIQDLSFPGRLAVLSSCHSGEGEWMPGEGVSGLSQAFLSTGARAVVGTLWAVDQEPTTLFIQEFYRRLASGETAGEALARAPEALRQGKYSGERFWAGFRLYGDPDWRLPVSAPAPVAKPIGILSSYGFWLLAAATLLFLFLAIRRKGS